LSEAIEKINQYTQPLGMPMPVQHLPTTFEEEIASKQQSPPKKDKDNSNLEDDFW
jgi:hypothetical protein